MALTPESRPSWQSSGNLPPATDIRPMTGVYYDAAGTPHVAYMLAPAPPGAASAGTGATAASSFVAVTPSDSVALPVGVQGLYFATAQTTLSVKGINNTTAAVMGAQAQGSTLRGQFGFVMTTGTSPGTGIVALIGG